MLIVSHSRHFSSPWDGNTSVDIPTADISANGPQAEYIMTSYYPAIASGDLLHIHKTCGFRNAVLQNNILSITRENVTDIWLYQLRNVHYIFSSTNSVITNLSHFAMHRYQGTY